MLSDLKKLWKNYLKKNPDKTSDHFKDPKRVVSKEKNSATDKSSTKGRTKPHSETPSKFNTPQFAKQTNSSSRSELRNVDKHGLRKIGPNEDLTRLFETASPGEAKKDTKKIDPVKPANRKETSGVKKPVKSDTAELRRQKGVDKNGFPILAKDVDLMGAFKDTSEVSHEKEQPPIDAPFMDAPEEEDFEDLLTQSISGKSVKKLLQEKDDFYQHAKPLTANTKIKRYPAPESELDLHGFTGPQARNKTEMFIRNELKTGKLTLRIIVGKGLHSEDQAVLPDVVEEKLKELKKEHVVLAYRWEKHIKRKSGAIIVYLV